eukprot:Ihof_evm2s1098 gene=Ihof_evmTU2s1098
MFALVKDLAGTLGAPAEGVALILALFLGLPLAALYQFIISRLPIFLRHVYVVITGVFLLYFNYEWQMLFVLGSILATWLVMVYLGPTQDAATASFVFNMLLLLGAYRVYATDNYDINWTTAQCVMCLRLIAVVFDYADSRKQEEEMTSDQKVNHVKQAPGLLEMFSFCLFFPALLVGPQITIRHYRAFMEQTNGGTNDRPSCMDCVTPALVAFSQGIVVLAVYHFLNPIFPVEYYATEEFLDIIPVWQKIGFMYLRGFVFFLPYMACWLFAEAACIMTGISYFGRSKDGSIQ